ncbi:unnamed protein product [Prorocentrum cordatum]|uniref:Uncharacterized protein n=1 Tax=Prorocentrum cordatum TaxID=2364126 RepID=A0ABN9XS65_9DINO|nr:unnamed protein product [Polarella glacialis]
MIATAASGAFNGAGADQVREWVDFVINVDVDPAKKHDLFHCVSVARLLAETGGSIAPADFEDPHMRDMIKGDPWKSWKVSPAQIVLALKVQGACAKKASPGPSVPPEVAHNNKELSGMAEAVKQFAELQSQALQKGKPKGLSFKLQDRKLELGMQHFAKDALPSEEVLAKFEAAGKIAHDKGRPWVGSAEGEDLRDHHRPTWSRTPMIDAVVGDGSYEERVKQSAAAKRNMAWMDKVDYAGFATFMGHLHEWGFKVILTKACSMADFLAYAHNIVRIAEEHGGVRTAYQYDVLQRRAMARALEEDVVDLAPYFAKIDRENLADAKDKVNKSFTEAGRAVTAKGQQSKGQPKGCAKGVADKGGKGSKKSSDGTEADNRPVRSPAKRPKGTAGTDYQHRSRSPRSGNQQYNSWGNKW